MQEWSIQEQQFTVPDTGFIFQFSSVHTEAVAAGEEPPSHDDAVVLRVWNREQTKCMVLWFDRRGEFVRSEMDGGDGMVTPAEMLPGTVGGPDDGQPPHDDTGDPEEEAPGMLDHSMTL